MVHVIRVELLQINLLSLLAYIHSLWNRIVWLSRPSWLIQSASLAARRQILLLVLLGERDFANLVSHIICALLLKALHEALNVAQLGEEEVFFDSVKFACHAKADERSDVSVTLRNHDIFAANDATDSQRGYLM